MPVRLSACIIAAPTGRIYMKFDIRDFMDISRENTNVAQIGQKYRTLRTTTYVRLIVIGDFKSL